MFFQVFMLLACAIIIAYEVDYTNKTHLEMAKVQGQLLSMQTQLENTQEDIQNMIAEYENLLELKENTIAELEKKIKILEQGLNLTCDVVLESFNTNTSTNTNNAHITNLGDLKINM